MAGKKRKIKSIRQFKTQQKQKKAAIGKKVVQRGVLRLLQGQKGGTRVTPSRSTARPKKLTSKTGSRGGASFKFPTATVKSKRTKVSKIPAGSRQPQTITFARTVPKRRKRRQ